jgi:hypothetical protein
MDHTADQGEQKQQRQSRERALRNGLMGIHTRVLWRRHLSHALLTRVGNVESLSLKYVLDSKRCCAPSRTDGCLDMDRIQSPKADSG